MTNIRLYDYLSFLLPGLLVSLALSFFFSYVIPLLPDGLRCQDLGSFGNSIIFLFIAFLIGHATQVFGNEFELRQLKYWGSRPLQTAKHTNNKYISDVSNKFMLIVSTILPCLRFFPFFKSPLRKLLGLVPAESGGGWYSRQLLRPEDTTYDLDTKKSIRLAAQSILDIPFLERDLEPTSDGEEKRRADSKNQRIFDRANRLILQQKVAPQTEDFNSQYGFYRGVCVALLMISWLATLTAVYFAIKLIAAYNEQGTTIYFYVYLNNLISAAVAFVVFDLFYFLFRRRYERFAFYFANSVYQNFLVWWLSKTGTSAVAKKENLSQT